MGWVTATTLMPTCFSASLIGMKARFPLANLSVSVTTTALIEGSFWHLISKSCKPSLSVVEPEIPSSL